MSTFSPRRIITALAVTIGVLIAGVAFAAWTQQGSGSGSAKATQAQSSTVSTDAATADLYPGFTAGKLYFKVNNPNPYPVRFTSLTPGAVTSSDPTGCPSSNVTVASKTGLAVDVPANTTTPVSRTVADVVSMSSAAPDGCQNATFTIAVSVSGIQQ